MRTYILAFALALCGAAAPAAAQSAAGEWNAVMNTPGGTREFKVILKVNGDSLSGTVMRSAGNVPLRGTVKGDAVNFSYTIDYGGNPLELTVSAKLTGDAIKGSIDLTNGVQEEFSMTRVSPAAKAPPAG